MWPLIQRPSRDRIPEPGKISVLFVIALCTVAGLSLVSQVMVQSALMQQASDYTLIALVSRQRTVSQQLVKATLAVQAFADSARRKPYFDELRFTIHNWEENRSWLENGNPGMNLSADQVSRLKTSLAKTRPYYISMLAAAKELLKLEQDDDGPLQLDMTPHVNLILDGEAKYLAVTDGMVGQIRQTAMMHVARLQRLEIFFVVVMLLLLTWLGLYLVRPTIGQLSNRLANLQESAETLRGANLELQEEANLRRAEAQERLRLLTTAVGDLEEGVVITDARWDSPGPRIVFANQSAGRIDGCSAAELVGRTPSILEDSGIDDGFADLRARLRDGRSGVARSKSRRPDGSTLHLEWHVLPVLSSNGQPTHYVAIERDVTDQCEAEESLRKTAQFSSTVLRSLPAHIAVLDISGTIVAVNEAWERLAGVEQEHPLGRPRIGVNYLELFHQAAQGPDGLPEARDALNGLRRVLDGSLPDFSVEYSANGVGMTRWYLLSASPLAGGAGAAVSHIDITKRKVAEEALRREKDFAESLIQTARAIVLVVDDEGRVIQFNRYLEDLTGKTLAETKGKAVIDVFFPPEERATMADRLRRISLGERLDPSIAKIIGKERRLDVEWIGTEIPGQNGAFLVIGHDITVLKETQHRLLQTERLAAIGETMSGLAHESRNALQRSQACLEMLALRLRDRPNELQLAEDVQTAQDHLHYLYEQACEYAGAVRLERRKVDVGVSLVEVWKELTSVLKKPKGELVVVDGAPDLHCHVDPRSIRQVFRNILENSMAATENSVHIRANWSETQLDGEPAIRLTIRDDGPGLSSEARERVFEPFFTTKIRGTGLGMSIAKRIVELHGGAIGVGSNGPGAEFHVTLPRSGT